MKVASWNVNSAKARLPHLLAFLEEAQPDVLCLQETKCRAEDFPTLEVKGLGYHIETIGQRSYNGVALLSRQPAEQLVIGLLGNDADDQARYIEASFGELRVASVYLPNGNPVGTDKFTYKLAWMERLVDHTRDLLRREIPFVLAGDYNICPTDDDVYDPAAYRDDALRIDHLLLSPQAADRITACDIDKRPRAKDRSSDHTPIWCELAL